MDLKRTDLIQQLVERHGYTKAAATSIVDDFTESILYNLENGNTVSLHGFGCFDLLERKERRCPNPQTGETVTVPAHYIPRFYPWRAMRRAVKVWEDNTKRGLA
jgi:nucleoid DNA-binding protein